MGRTLRDDWVLSVGCLFLLTMCGRPGLELKSASDARSSASTDTMPQQTASDAVVADPYDGISAPGADAMVLAGDAVPPDVAADVPLAIPPDAAADAAAETPTVTEPDAFPAEASPSTLDSGRRVLGQACTTSSECESVHCVDGVCCDQGCEGPCANCARPESRGRCVPLPVGTACGAPHCEVRTYTPQATCDGLGLCRIPARIDCAFFRCAPDGTRCLTACGDDSDCVIPAVCISNLCGNPRTGAPCTAAADCASGFCWRDVCCNTRCADPCMVCDLPHSFGRCMPVTDGGCSSRYDAGVGQ